jgi:hypothetical protein
MNEFITLRADGKAINCPQCDGKGHLPEHTDGCNPEHGCTPDCPQPTCCHFCDGAGEFTAAEILNAVGEKNACHHLFDQVLRICGHDPKKGHPMMTQAVEAVVKERDALRGKVEELQRDVRFLRIGPIG